MPTDDSARQIRQRLEAIMQRMGQAVRLTDQRQQPAESLHQGFRTRGAGAEAAWEFRFLEAPPGLQEGSLLSVDGEDERWRVQRIHVEKDGAELLFVSAHVVDLEAELEPVAESVASLLESLQQILKRSTLGPLEHDDVNEALERLTKLAAAPAGPASAQRIHTRLRLLSERFKACPQTAHEAKGALLRLEAQLKRKGLL